MSKTKYLYGKLTWMEVNEAVKADKVIVVPVAAIEQHGPHLPIDTDDLAVTTICERAAEKEPSQLLCAPTIHYGFAEQNMDFPGTITIDPGHFVHYCIDVASSFARQGFRHIILVNGHGGNAHLLESVSRLVTLRCSVMCAYLNYWDLVREEFDRIRESEYPGGALHACEFETSVYLYLAPSLVQRDKIQKGIRPRTKYFWQDLCATSPVKFTPWRSMQTKTGIGGDPTLSTKEKGEVIVNAAVDALIDVAREFKLLYLGERRNLRAVLENAEEEE